MAKLFARCVIVVSTVWFFIILDGVAQHHRDPADLLLPVGAVVGVSAGAWTQRWR
jgi:hypothetical protein